MFRGSMVALVTPMNEDGSVHWESLDQLVEWHIENGTDAIVAVGTTGESATLEFDEHIEVIKRVVDVAKGRIPVIGGTGANSTSEAIALTKGAMEAGVDGCLLVTPYYNKPTQEGLYQHYKAVAEAVAVPQILYNVPGRTACDLLPETVDRLADIANIVALKEAHGSMERIEEVINRCGDRLDILSGDDGNAREAILKGAKGVISVTANVAPKQMHELCAAALNGDAELAEKIDAQLTDVHNAMFLETSPMPVKWALHAMGKIPAGIRLPLVALSDEFKAPLMNTIKAAGL